MGTLSVFATMGELSSMYETFTSSYIFPKLDAFRAPTAGGQYHWVSMLAPPSMQRFLSYIIGESLLHSLAMVSTRLTLIKRLAHCLWLASSGRIWRFHLCRSHHGTRCRGQDRSQFCATALPGDVASVGSDRFRCFLQHCDQPSFT